MATWGTGVANTNDVSSPSNQIALGYDLSASHSGDKTNVTWTLTVYLRAGYSISDSSNSFSISGNWSRSGSIAVSIPSGGNNPNGVALYSGTYTQYGLGPGSTSTSTFSSTISGLYEYGNAASVGGDGSYRIPPNLPTMGTLSLSAGIRYIDLSWGLSSNGGATVDRYDVYRNGSYWTTTYGQDNRSIRDTVSNGITNNYTVYAHNEAGWSGASNTPSATTPSLPTVPGSFTANNSTFGQIGLSWTASSGSGYPITYHISRTPTGYTASTTGLTATDTTVAPYTDYTYSIIARTDVGDSGPATVSVKSMGGVVNVKKSTTGYDKVIPQVRVGSSWVKGQARVYDNGQWKHGI